jgi:hypothetical protein
MANPTIKKQGPISMELIVAKLDDVALKVTSIEAAVTIIKEKQLLTQSDLATLITPPNVEARLRKYVDDTDEHRKANVAQTIVQTQTIITQGQKILELQLEAQIKDVALAQAQTETDRKSDHSDMVKHQDHVDEEIENIKKYIWMGLGGLAVLTTALKFVKF